MREARGFAKGRPVVAAIWLLAALAAVTQVVRLGVFMFDPYRTSASILPTNQFFISHTCLSSFTEAARFARQGGVNVYDPRVYLPDGCQDLLNCGERSIGPLKVDLYQYPPTFLALPVLMRAMTSDFFKLRFGWFLVQVTLLLAATLFLTRWIGGRAGRVAAVLSVVLWISPSTLVGLQIGNFQATAFALSILGMLALTAGPSAAGGLALGFAAASKLYPGLLVVYIAGRKDWRALAWVAAGGAAATLASLALVGTKPFIDFVQYQMPRISSGDAFFWIEVPPAIPVNYGIHGLLLRLRLLGILDSTVATPSVVSSLYGAVLAAAAFLAGRAVRRTATTDHECGRLHEAQVWLALLNLGSFRSPFVPDAYALMGTLWLLTLIAAGRSAITIWQTAAFVVAAAAFAIVLDGFLPQNPPAWIVAGTLAVQIAALAVNGWVLLRTIVVRTAARTVTAPAVA